MRQQISSDTPAVALGALAATALDVAATPAEAGERWLSTVQASFRNVGVPLDVVRALMRLAHPAVLPKGTQLLHRGQAADRHWLLLTGHAAMGLAEQGRMRQQTREVAAGQWIDNASALLGAHATYLEDAVIEQESLVWSFSHADVARCGTRHPQLLLGWASALVGRVQDMLMAELSLMRQSTESRFAAWLLQNAEPAAAAPEGATAVSRVVLRQRKRALASQLGATPETFSRVLKQLALRGAVNVQGYTIELTNMGMLKELAEQGR